MSNDAARRTAGSTAAIWAGGVLLAVVVYALSFGPVVAFSEKWHVVEQVEGPARIVYAPLGYLYENTQWGQQWLDDYVHWWNKVLGTPPTKL